MSFKISQLQLKVMEHLKDNPKCSIKELMSLITGYSSEESKLVTLNRSLKTLRDEELVSASKIGRWLFYSLTDLGEVALGNRLPMREFKNE